MKQTLIEFKNSKVKVLKENSELKKQRRFFNLKVEERKNELNIIEIFKDSEDSYNAARLLNYLFPQIQIIVQTLRKKHYRYGEERIKQATLLALNDFMQENDFNMGLFDKTQLIVDNYFLYENCGFFKVLDLETSLIKTKCNVKENNDVQKTMKK